MRDVWQVTPLFFERVETGFEGVVPEGAERNDVSIPGRGPGELEKAHAPIRDFVARTAKAGDRPVVMAGDCCAAMPVVAGLQDAGVAPTLVWLDSHGDFNTPETSPSQFLGGMPLAMLVGRGPQWLMEADGVRVLEETDVVLVGARDLDPLEAEALDGSRVRQMTVEAAMALKVEGPVHLHFDTDLLDAEAFGAFNYPVPGGPDLAQMQALLEAIDDRCDVRALSVSGWNGSLDDGGRGTAVFGKMLARFGARLGAQAG
ncbi:MAG: arginase family protein [Pseudomonadota bacterium]